MNAKKTKTMVFSKSSNPPNTRIHIEGKLIEKVQTFTYLGALMTEDGRSEKEIKRRINIAKRTFQKKSKLLTSHDLSYATKIRLVKCYIWATFLYGCETWTLTESIEKKITAFEMWIYKRISRTPCPTKDKHKEHGTSPDDSNTKGETLWPYKETWQLAKGDS